MPSSPAQDDGSYDNSEVQDYADVYPSVNNARVMGIDSRGDSHRAQALLHDPAALIHDYDPQNWPGKGPYIVTGNRAEIPPVVHTDQNWSNSMGPSLVRLAESAHYPEQSFPHAEDSDLSRYADVTSDYIHARVAQNLAQTAYGSLDDVGRRLAQDPNDPSAQHAMNVSVDASFDVMTTASQYAGEVAAMNQKKRDMERERMEGEIRKRAKSPSRSSQASGSRQPKRKRK